MRNPVTLVHGDVHPGNISVEDQRARLVDWANARCGPAMLDVANICDLGSVNMIAYRRSFGAAGGRALDDHPADRVRALCDQKL